MTDFKFLVTVLCASAMTNAPARAPVADPAAGDA